MVSGITELYRDSDKSKKIVSDKEKAEELGEFFHRFLRMNQ